MPQNGSLPTTDQGILEFLTPLSAKLTALPVPFGITAGMAANLAVLLDTYSGKLDACRDPATRGAQTCYQKNVAKANLIAYARLVIRQVQGTSTVTNEQRQDLGIHIRKAEPTPIGIPSQAPEVDVISVSGRTVKIRLHSPSVGTKRGKPATVVSARLFSYVGATPPEGAEGWAYVGGATKTVVEIPFPTSVPAGSRVWIIAQWVNAKDQTGAASAPVSTYIAGGTSLAA